MKLSLTVNGADRSAQDVWPGTSLLTALREEFGLTGAKNACEQGECGSCTVYLDGDPVCSCLVAAAQAEGRQVRTVEGLGGPEAVQRAFLACGAVQCGFCTPGLVVAVHDLVHRIEDPDEATIREALAGNLCRCTGYEKIIEAVRCAAAELRAELSEHSAPPGLPEPSESSGPVRR
ncbi:MAG: (2Fe-2S)-binding protein [Catenulispora sp.]|nr:(2Fe-2S)-binding protein [Catenulispora sp.]